MRALLPLLLGLVACGAAVRPEAPTAAAATGRDACGKTGTATREPLVVDMQPEKRADLEAAFADGRGLVAVHYTCDELVVVRDCRVRGAYARRSYSPKTQLTTMTSEDEVAATLPVGTTRQLAARGGISRGAAIDLELTMASVLEARDASFDSGALQGPCDGVTHVVQAATLGAFRLTQSSHGRTGGDVSAMGAEVKASSSDEKRTLAREGKPEACDDPATAARSCDAVLRLVLAPIGEQLPPVDLREHAAMVAKLAPCRNGLDDCRSRCDARDARACFELGALLGASQPPVLDPTGAARALHKGCMLGAGVACGLLALDYLVESSAVKNVELGRKLAERACQLGEGPGCFTMAASLERSDPAAARAYVAKGCHLSPNSSECRR